MAVARTSAGFIKIRPARPGAHVAIVAPASPLTQASVERDVLRRGAAELTRLGFQPVIDAGVRLETGYTAGDARSRAASLTGALRDPSIDAIIALRGGFGSMHLLPLLDPAEWALRRTALVGYSDITSLHVFLNCQAGLVSLHGPMIDQRFSDGPEAYDPSSFLTALVGRPPGELPVPNAEILMPGDDAVGPVLGGTLSMLTASLGTPYAFDPPAGFILYLDDVNERPFRIDRMLTQLKYAGILAKAAAIVCNGMRDCDEPAAGLGNNAAAEADDARPRPTVRGVLRDVLAGFPGPVVFGLTSGHDAGEGVTIPFGVRGRVTASPRARLIMEEAAADD